MKTKIIRKVASKPSGNYYKPSWSNTENIDWNKLAAMVREARKDTPKETEAQVIARERNREHRGELHHARRFDY
jgi:hypothetical protein